MQLIEQFTEAAIRSGRFQPLDKIYVANRVRALVGDEDVAVKPGQSIVQQLVDLAVARGKIADGPTACEILNDQLYDLLTPLPSAVNHLFWEKYEQSPQTATDWFYQLCTNNDYVKVAAIKKNVVFKHVVKGGNELEITTNLSKP